MEHDHQVLVSVEVHACWVQKLDHLGGVRNLDDLFDFLTDRGGRGSILEVLMSVETIRIEVEIVGWLVLVGFGALKRVQLEVAQAALLRDVVEGTENDKDWLG